MGVWNFVKPMSKQIMHLPPYFLTNTLITIFRFHDTKYQIPILLLLTYYLGVGCVNYNVLVWSFLTYITWIAAYVGGIAHGARLGYPLFTPPLLLSLTYFSYFLCTFSNIYSYQFYFSVTPIIIVLYNVVNNLSES